VKESNRIINVEEHFLTYYYYYYYLLLTPIGLTPGGSSKVHIYTQTAQRIHRMVLVHNNKYNW
jgi:hypothetical protein